jgi:hypothetical protein
MQQTNHPTICVDRETYDEIVRMASADGTPMSQTIRNIIQREHVRRMLDEVEKEKNE